MTQRYLRMLALLLLASCDGEDPSRPDAGGDRDSGLRRDSGSGDAGPSTPDARTRDTWTNYAQGFFETYCTECHDESPRDFRALEDVRTNAPTTRCGVSDVELDDCAAWPPPRQFPIGTGPRPSDEERARLVAWIDDGMPE